MAYFTDLLNNSHIFQNKNKIIIKFNFFFKSVLCLPFYLFFLVIFTTLFNWLKGMLQHP